MEIELESRPGQDELDSAAEENVEMFRQLAEHIHEVLYVYDAVADRILFVNPAYEEIWQRSRRQLYTEGTPFLDAVVAGDRVRLLEARERQRRGAHTSVEYRIQRPDGAVRWIHDRAFVLSANGGGYRVLGIAEDVSAHKSTEERLKDQSASLERLVSLGQSLISERIPARIIQRVLDTGRELCGATYAAYFHNPGNVRSGNQPSIALSGALPEIFPELGRWGANQYFRSLFGSGKRTQVDSWWPKTAGLAHNPFAVPAPDHLAAVSLMSVPVVSRHEDLLGGICFGHIEPDAFNEFHVHLAEQLATEAAIALENARLFEMLQREQELTRSSRQDYQFLAESSPQIVFIANPLGSITYFNRHWFKSTGLDEIEDLNLSWQLALHPDDALSAQERWQWSVATGESYEVESRLRGADMRYRWHLSRALPLKDESGQILKWVGTTTDIDAQKRSLETLRFLANAGTVLNSSLDYNQTVLRLAQLTVPALCDWCLVDLITDDGALRRLAVSGHEPDAAPVSCLLDSGSLKPGKTAPGVSHVLRTGQSHLLDELSYARLATAIRNPESLQLPRNLEHYSLICVPLSVQGQTLGVLSLIAAESGRHFNAEDLLLAEELGRRAGEAVRNAHLYQEAQRALARANDAMRARDEFLAIVSHELKTPLTPILGWVSMLQSMVVQPGAEPTVDHALRVIERSVRSQSQLINDLLDVSRIVTGKLRLDIRPIELQPAFEAALETVRPSALAKEITLDVKIAPVAGKVQGDPERLQQVAWNLLANAIKFTPRGGHVTVCLEQVESQVQLTVSDTGAGIPPEFLPYIFDRFQQLDSSPTRQYGGLGLGLAIVRHLVEMHGGTVTARSEGSGQGATFEVCLPLVSAAETYVIRGGELTNGDSELDFVRAASTHESRDLLHGVQLLLVEGDPDARDLLTAVLERYGAKVRLAPNAVDGFRIAAEWHPDVLLVDLALPGDDGYTFMRQLRSLPATLGGKTPAIALMSYLSPEERLKALSVGFQNHLTKPVEPAEVAITVASVLGRTILV